MFNGYALVQFAIPKNGSTAYPSVSIDGQFPARTLPISVKIPIRDGVFAPDVAVPYTADITPPSSFYEAWYYESNDVQIAGPTSAFTVASDPFTLPQLTLPVSVAGTITQPAT